MIINIRALSINTVKKWQVPDNLVPKVQMGELALRVQKQMPALIAVCRFICTRSAEKCK
jgi:hypothetical protein